MGKTTETIILKTEEEVAKRLAAYTVDHSKRFIDEKGSFTVVLSGGTLIRTMRYLAEYRELVEWSKWRIFWVDERVVPHTSEFSNYKLAWEGFLYEVTIPEANILAIDDTKESPSEAAADYEARLRDWVEKGYLPLSSDNFPIHDLMLLGMGPDGHVASLFPDRTQQFETKRWVTSIDDSPKPPNQRITYTFPVINAATHIAMVVTGSNLLSTVKKDVAITVKKVLETPNSTLPAAKVRPQGRLTWFLDSDAASQL